jgi:exo-beta-1,3-glucanase (GH17 family)
MEMNQRTFLSRLLAIIFMALTLLALVVFVPAGSAGMSAAHAASAPFSVHLPIVMREWFNTGPHFPLGYGPYRTGQAPGGAQPSAAQINEDLGIIQNETALIRIFGACGTTGTLPALAGQHHLRLYQGVDLTEDTPNNSREMSCYNALLEVNTNIFGGIIGNETLLRGDLTEPALISFINQARQMGSTPLSTAETWDTWCSLKSQKPRCPGRPLLGESVDFIAANIYPYWEGVSIEQAAAHVMAVTIALGSVYPDKKIILSEAGWPSCGAVIGNAVPGLAEQKRFISELWRWSNLYDVQVMYFEAFDEPWKVNAEGQVGGCWGIYDVKRTPKHNDLDWSLPVPTPAPALPAVHIEHPQGITTTVTEPDCSIPIFGRVYNAGAGWHVKVEVLTNQWYIQDKWYDNGLAPIIQGMWSMPEITLGGQGQYNNHSIRATLVDETGAAQASDEVSSIIRSNACTP